MKLSDGWLLPFIIQGLFFCVDEFYFHLKRGLPRWERIGHPIDTLSVVACLAVPFFLSPTHESLLLYGALSIFSCVLITKDEFIHKQHSTGIENWLHSILFILHPLVFITAGLIWYDHSMAPLFNEHLWLGLKIQAAATSFFLFYQIFFWSFIWKPSPK